MCGSAPSRNPMLLEYTELFSMSFSGRRNIIRTRGVTIPMARRRFIVLGLLLVAAGAGGYMLWRPGPDAPVVGVVRTTEIRVAPEVGGQLAAIKVEKGARVRAGDVVAELSALQLTAAVGQARAALAAASADRDHVYAGVRAEEIAALAAGIAKAKSKLE